MFRHAYCAARLQTVDQGAPVSVFTVARERGARRRHDGAEVYGHLGQVRRRAEVMEYRVDEYATKLGDRLEALPGERLASPLAPRRTTPRSTP
jgi:hypothetical protein